MNSFHMQFKLIIRLSAVVNSTCLYDQSLNKYLLSTYYVEDTGLAQEAVSSAVIQAPLVPLHPGQSHCPEKPVRRSVKTEDHSLWDPDVCGKSSSLENSYVILGLYCLDHVVCGFAEPGLFSWFLTP